MGGLQSTFRSSKVAVKANKSPVESVLPIYYTKDELTDTELEAVLKVWGLITSSRAETYVHLRRFNPSFGFSNCSEYFYQLFYDKLLDVHPGAKVLFKKDNKRMRQYFVGSFTMLLDSINDVDKFNRTLVSLAHVHNNIGVKAIECKQSSSRSFYKKMHKLFAPFLSLRWFSRGTDYVCGTTMLW